MTWKVFLFGGPLWGEWPQYWSTMQSLNKRVNKWSGCWVLVLLDTMTHTKTANTVHPMLWWRHGIENFPHCGPLWGESPHNGPVMQRFYIIFVNNMNPWVNEWSGCWMLVIWDAMADMWRLCYNINSWYITIECNTIFNTKRKKRIETVFKLWAHKRQPIARPHGLTGELWGFFS